MKIGYAITTTPARYDRDRDYFQMCEKDSVCVLHNDFKEEGMATAKNRCIKYLYDAGCDYFVLMDDDTRILKEGFGPFLVGAHVYSGIHHFTIPGNGAKVIDRKEYLGFGVKQWSKGAGVMLFATREAIGKVGYMNVNYPSKWGHAHIGWSIRILKSGLMEPFKGWRLSVDGWEEYFYSEDIQGGEPVKNYTEKQKSRAMKINSAEHRRENRGPIYYPYAERKEAVVS